MPHLFGALDSFGTFRRMLLNMFDFPTPRRSFSGQRRQSLAASLPRIEARVGEWVTGRVGLGIFPRAWKQSGQATNPSPSMLIRVTAPSSRRAKGELSSQNSRTTRHFRRSNYFVLSFYWTQWKCCDDSSRSAILVTWSDIDCDERSSLNLVAVYSSPNHLLLFVKLIRDRSDMADRSWSWQPVFLPPPLLFLLDLSETYDVIRRQALCLFFSISACPKSLASLLTAIQHPA